MDDKTVHTFESLFADVERIDDALCTAKVRKSLSDEQADKITARLSRAAWGFEDYVVRRNRSKARR